MNDQRKSKASTEKQSAKQAPRGRRPGDGAGRMEAPGTRGHGVPVPPGDGEPVFSSQRAGSAVVGDEGSNAGEVDLGISGESETVR
jgi:hypothetical protein